jgi:hypothetical protein
MKTLIPYRLLLRRELEVIIEGIAHLQLRIWFVGILKTKVSIKLRVDPHTPKAMSTKSDLRAKQMVNCNDYAVMQFLFTALAREIGDPRKQISLG